MRVRGDRSARSRRIRPRRTTPRRLAVAGLLTLAAGTLAACGGDASAGGVPTLDFHNNNPVQGKIAQRCAEASGGRYRVNPIALPADASGQREQLLRRLAAKDPTIDIVSLDPPFMAEMANAGFLRPFTEEERREFSEGMLAGPVEQSIFDNRMFSAPFYGNTQLLWFKKSVAERAGIDPTRNEVTWDQLIDAGVQTGTTVAGQGRRNESLMVWVNALVESAGGSILDPASQTADPENVEPTIDSPAGAEAARIMSKLANSQASFPGFSTSAEEDSRSAFQQANGGFMVNWPYVWSAFDDAIEAGSLPANFKDDVGWARYPRATPDRPSAPPSGGIGLSIGAFSPDQQVAVEAVRCIRDLRGQKEYMVGAGDPGAATALYDDPDVRKQFPMADEIREGMSEAAPRPISPYYGDVTSGIQRTYHPPNAVSPEITPNRADSLLKGVLSGQQLL